MGNHAEGDGGGLFNVGALTLTHSTVADNSAGIHGGGGLFNSLGATLTLTHSILARNMGEDCSNGGGTVTIDGPNLIMVDDGCDPTNLARRVDPFLGPLADNGGPTQTQALPANSPALDAVPVDADCPETDQRGVPRPQGDGCDLGAYERSFSAAFDGFFAPVDNPPTVNTVKAGQSVPVKFSLGGDHGLTILAEGSPASREVECDGSSPSDPVEVTESAGDRGLQYAPASDTYTYVWKTSKGWAGSCRELVVRFTDTLEHTALFQFQ